MLEESANRWAAFFTQLPCSRSERCREHLSRGPCDLGGLAFYREIVLTLKGHANEVATEISPVFARPNVFLLAALPNRVPAGVFPVARLLSGRAGKRRPSGRKLCHPLPPARARRSRLR